MNPRFKIILKGFAMGTADIVPGVSGGTVALILGIYERLIRAISSVDKTFLNYVLKLEVKNSLDHIDFKFLAPLLAGIMMAIISMSRVLHYLLNNFSVYTWSVFFGLICASILFLLRKVPNAKSGRSVFTVILGTCIGYGVVSLVPVQTANTGLMIFLSGCVAICAMILPGISGSFILLILGKYMFITSALKNPFSIDNLFTLFAFCSGCLVGILSFSRIINYFLTQFYSQALCLLTGFMIGSLRKIWPWREVVEEKVIRGKTHILKDIIVLPDSFDGEVIFAIILMLLGFFSVLLLEKLNNHKSGVSSAG